MQTKVKLKNDRFFVCINFCDTRISRFLYGIIFTNQTQFEKLNEAKVDPFQITCFLPKTSFSH